MNRFNLNTDGTIRRGDFVDAWRWGAAVRYWIVNLGYEAVSFGWGSVKVREPRR